MASGGNNIKGITVKIGGDTLELTKALESATKTASETGKELSQVGKQLKYDPSNVTLLAQKHELLGKKITATEKTLETLNNAKRAFWDTHDVNDEQAQAQYRALEREVEKTEASLKKAKKEFNETSEASVRLANTAEKLKNLGKAISGVGKELTLKLTLPLAAAGAAVVKVASDFDTEMSRVQALSGATGESLDTLREKARELGSQTKYSASEVASGFEYMSLAGWNVEQQLSGIDGVLNLAAAAAMDLGEASDIVTDYLSAFGLSAEYAGKMADEMAYAQANSNTTVTQLGEAYKNSAANMHAAGQTMETTTSLLEGLANQGTKGAEAGTQLAAVMRDITAKMKDGKIQIGDTSIAVQDVDGNFRDLLDILGDVETATEGMGSAEQSAAIMATFTARSVRAVNQVLTEGTDTIRGYRDELESADGTAADMAATMQDNLAGQLTQLKSQLEELAISFGEILMPVVRDIVAKIQDFVNWLNSLDEDVKNVIVTVGMVMALAGPLLLLIGGIITAIGNLHTALSYLYAHPIVAGLAAVAALITAIAVAVATATEAGDEYRKKADEIRSSIDELNASTEKTIAAGAGEAAMASDLVSRLEELRSRTDLTAAEQAEMADIVEMLNELYPDLNLEIDEQTGALNKTNSELERYIDNQLKAAKVEAYKDKITELYKKEAEAAMNVAEAEEALAAEREKNANLTREEMDALGGHAIDVNNLELALNDAKTAQEEVNGEIERAKGLYREASGELWTASGATRDTASALGEVNMKTIEATESFGNVASISQETAETFAGAVGNIITSTQSAIESQMNMFEKFNDESSISTEELLNNMQSQIQGVEEWEQELAYLADKGINQDLLQHLAQMGPQGKQYADAFVKMVEEGSLSQANELWTKALNIQGMTNEWGIQLQESAATNIMNAMPDVADAFYQSGEDSAMGYYNGIVENLAQAAEAATEMGEDSVAALNTSIGAASPAKRTEEAGQYFIMGFALAVTQNANAATEPVRMLAVAIVTVFTRALISGRDQAAIAATSLAAAAAGALVTAVSANYGAIQAAGVNLDRGFANGISAGQYMVVTAAEAMAVAAVNAAKRALDINSPSGVFEDIGDDTVAGYVNSLIAGQDEVADAMSQLVTPDADLVHAASASGGAYGSASNAYNYGGITMNIYQQPGESGEALARRLMGTLNMQLRTLQRNGG